MKTLGNIYLLLLVALFSACNDPYEDSTYQVYDMNPVSSYLETRSDEFSTMGEEKPARASAGVRIPKTRSAARAVSATMSALTLPQINMATVMIKILSVIVML